jgi:predicted transposase/invertase (TIGR01784 family)
MQLANLDNEIFFKKVFTDPDVFRAFVKDVTGVDIINAKIETEKRLERKVAAINFKLDIYAESQDARVVIEIQRIDYDYSFDRFLHYFLAMLVDLQRCSKDYSFEQDVYTIVVLTSPYVVKENTGKLIQDDVLITDLNPRTLANEIRKVYPHKLIFLNPNYASPDTPAAIQDWLEFILTSIKSPDNPKFNQANAAIVKAAAIADIQNMPESVLEDAKIAHAKKKTSKIYAAIEHEKGIEEGKAIAAAAAEKNSIEVILGFYDNGVPIPTIAKSFSKTIEDIDTIIKIHRK